PTDPLPKEPTRILFRHPYRRTYRLPVTKTRLEQRDPRQNAFRSGSSRTFAMRETVGIHSGRERGSRQPHRVVTMTTTFVPTDFDVPSSFQGPGFHLEPLGPVHNERDHEAWMSSIDHIRSTPGMDWKKWPTPMTREQNLADMEMHAGE